MNLGCILDAMKNSEVLKTRPVATPEQLTQLYARYKQPHDIRPGDLVMWKPELKNRLLPNYGEAMVVLEVVPGRLETGEGGSNREREPADTRIGFLANSGAFDGWWIDGARLMPYEPPACGEKTAATEPASPEPADPQREPASGAA